MRFPLCLLAALLLATCSSEGAPVRPNIIIVLADDLGIGDLKPFNPASQIKTPVLDRLAAGGMIFTDAHSGSAVCSPTRYGIITGRYSWRTPLKQGVLGGLSPHLIEDGRQTIASFLKSKGYATACVGKWHLGMDWAKLPGKDVSDLNIETREQVFNVDYSQAISHGPNAFGFDDYFGIAASLDMVPYTFIRNDRVDVLPTEDRDFPLVMGIEGKPTRKGPAAPGFTAEGVLPELTKHAIHFVESRADGAKNGKPFFLYLPLASPHTPIAPTSDWQGKSGLNFYGDFVMQTDAAIGQLVATIDRLGLTENTLILVTSDNGCSPFADYPLLTSKGHNPSGPFRGTKADIFEGGHRIPFIAHWPGKIGAGKSSPHLVCLGDLFATCADILNEKLPSNVAEDSLSFWPVLRGDNNVPARTAVVHHSVNGSFAIREGKWKLILCPDSGGWSEPRPNRKANASLPPVQLYDLESDIAEAKNLHADYPKIVQRLTELLQKYQADGRSTPTRE